MFGGAPMTNKFTLGTLTLNDAIIITRKDDKWTTKIKLLRNIMF